MIAHWIGYLVVVLVLAVIRKAIDDGCRDRALAWALCVVLVVALVALCLLARWRLA